MRSRFSYREHVEPTRGGSSLPVDRIKLRPGERIISFHYLPYSTMYLIERTEHVVDRLNKRRAPRCGR